MDEAFKQAFPKNVFAFTKFNDHINEAYGTELIARNQILFFTMIAIGIACLGLLGMIANRAEEKTKEIGIRKVMGARLDQLAFVLVNISVRQLIVATVVGIPVAYYLTNQYLIRFSDRIELRWWHGALPILMLSSIMILTMASHLLKAMKANPVEALKYE
jgi:putative ABC transport system permease protein